MKKEITTYATIKDETRHQNEQTTYLSADFQIGFPNKDYPHDYDTVLHSGNLVFPYQSRFKMEEFANLLNAFHLGIWNENEENLCLDCLILSQVLVDNFPALRCEIHYIKTYGGKTFTKDVFLSKAKCFSLANIINKELEENKVEGRTLVINT